MFAPPEIYEEFRRIGQFLDRRMLISSHAGNISTRHGNKIYIKRRGAMLGDLKPEDVIETGLNDLDSSILISSTETGVHQAIYNATSHLAVVHCHPPHVVALSMIEDDITAIDAEGAFTIKRIPVVSYPHPVGAIESAIYVPPVLQNYPVVCVRSHGIFAGGVTLEEAYMYATIAEEVATIRYLTLLTGKPILTDASERGKFDIW
ncbi:MAG TPA: class II aldolase/adducin family protein [Candidatus Lokiarchaeia archaeon]|nr:class II aldolase/adducin family protein [Candidatus Lokiarchaeia archaeon]